MIAYLLACLLHTLTHWHTHLLDLVAQPDTPDHVWPLYNTLPAFYATHPVVFCAMVLNTFQMIWEAFTLREQYLGIAHNLTHNEALNGDKYHYFQTPSGGLFNPFDKGWSNNVRSFFLGDGIDYTRLYFLNQEPGEVV